MAAVTDTGDDSRRALAAFNYDYDALEGGGRSPILKGYEDIL